LTCLLRVKRRKLKESARTPKLERKEWKRKTFQVSQGEGVVLKRDEAQGDGTGGCSLVLPNQSLMEKEKRGGGGGGKTISISPRSPVRSGGFCPGPRGWGDLSLGHASVEWKTKEKKEGLSLQRKKRGKEGANMGEVVEEDKGGRGGRGA